VRWEDKIILSLSKGVFLGGIGRIDFFGGWELSRGVFFGRHGREMLSLVLSQGRKFGLFLFFKELFFLVMWNGVVGEGGGYILFFSFFFIIR
jgi:hypothetical protein